MKHKIRGYSAFELVAALVIIGTILYFGFNYSNKLISQTAGQSVAQQAYDYSREMVRYLDTHQNLLRYLLSQNSQTNGQVATVSPQVLKNEGFIKGDTYFKNRLNQYPCTIIWYDNHQLQAILYYRNDKNVQSLNNYQWIYGLNHMGAMVGLYVNGQVSGSAKDWALDSNFIKQMFLKQGSADLSQGANPGLYSCQGAQISDPSYVVNITSMLDIPQTLPKDDTIHQYSDILSDVDDPANNNRMNIDVNLDSRGIPTSNTISNIVFQMNPNCVMNPSKLMTIQDYDPDTLPKDDNDNKPNVFGCKNRQLAIQSITNPIDNSQEMVVTGFNSVADKSSALDDNIHYVGEVNAASIQPSTQIAVGNACRSDQLGTMAQQQRSSDANDLNNIYVSQVICMKSPLCDSSTNGYCYMPVENVTIQYTPNTASFTCPTGTIIDQSSVLVNHINRLWQVTCPSFGGSCYADKSEGGGLTYSPSNGVPSSLLINSTQWHQQCPHEVHGGCNSGWGNIGNTQDTISSINCTNDPSKAGIIINQ